MSEPISPSEQTHKCCICGRTFNGWGNNPHPVKDSGRCCDACNHLVIAMRMAEMKMRMERGEN